LRARHQFLDRIAKPSFGLFWLAVLLSALSWGSGLPGVGGILDGFSQLWSEDLPHDVGVSCARWLIGWALGCAIGIVLGLLTGRLHLFRTAFEGFFVLLRAIPFISLVPVMLRVFGLAESGKFFLVGWASAGACWVIVHQRSMQLPDELIWRAQSLGASRWVWISRVLLPSCGEGLFSALRTSLALGLIVVAVAELGGVFERSPDRWWSGGLGYRLFRSSDMSRDDLMLATVVSFALLGIAVDQIFVAGWVAVGRVKFRLRQKLIETMLAPLERSRLSPVEFDHGAPALVVRGLQAAYDGRTIFSDLTCTVAAGTTMTVIGPSGSGKTTLIRSIGRFSGGSLSFSGDVCTDEQPIIGPGPRVGVVLQNAPVFEHMTVWDNLTFGSHVRAGLGTAEVRARCMRLLIDFGLERAVVQRADTLSGGQRQRLALAMVLANAPEVLLLDEPFGALDAITRRQLQEFYWRKVSGKVTAVFVTHDLEEALLVGDVVRVGVGADGAMLAVNKAGHPPHEWELTGAFSDLRIQLIQTLEQVNGYKAPDRRP
jgi:ABC-type nitrate/sulfonate/bicarbonate transport system ATPase subunit/ABC-type nitrate/sulfonate/bicarbonate transport system permease component